MIPVAERFISINGEGQHAGYLAAFIRVKGCNLSCNYCDTAWANRPDCPCELMEVEDLVSYVRETGVSRVTLTGGEPLLVPEIDGLIRSLSQAGIRVEIETNGSVDIRPFAEIRPRPSFTLDHKCPGSGMDSRMLTDHYACLLPQDTVKFVVSDRRDLDHAYEICARCDIGKRCTILLSPVFGRIEGKEIVDYMMEKHWNDARLQLQLHKYIWPPDARGV